MNLPKTFCVFPHDRTHCGLNTTLLLLTNDYALITCDQTGKVNWGNLKTSIYGCISHSLFLANVLEKESIKSEGSIPTKISVLLCVCVYICVYICVCACICVNVSECCLNKARNNRSLNFELFTRWPKVAYLKCFHRCIFATIVFLNSWTFFQSMERLLYFANFKVHRSRSMILFILYDYPSSSNSKLNHLRNKKTCLHLLTISV